MNFKVREVGVAEEKSIQEREQELLDKAEQDSQDNGDTQQTEETTVEEQPTEASLTEDDVLSFIKSRYNKEITSVDQLFAEREEGEELPEDVKAYYEYRKTTGRGIEDYIKLNRDFDSMNDDQVLREYFLMSGEAIDNEDADMMLEDYQWDDDLDEEKDIKKKKLALKKAIVKAKEYLNQQKEMYKQPLESSTVGLSQEDKKELESYRQYVNEAKTQEQETKRKMDWFLQKTNEVFQDFKGFDFTIGDATLTYSPATAAELKESQLNPQNFITKFLDESGLIKDAKGYHKALAVAMNPERFAKFFYEQGKADAIDGTMRKLKNVDMTDRRVPEVSKKDGLQVRALNPSDGRGLRIKSKNR